MCKDVVVVVGLWWCDGVENKCWKRKLAFGDCGSDVSYWAHSSDYNLLYPPSPGAQIVLMCEMVTWSDPVSQTKCETLIMTHLCRYTLQILLAQ